DEEAIASVFALPGIGERTAVGSPQPHLFAPHLKGALDLRQFAAGDELAQAREAQVRPDHALPVAVLGGAAPVRPRGHLPELECCTAARAGAGRPAALTRAPQIRSTCSLRECRTSWHSARASLGAV